MGKRLLDILGGKKTDRPPFWFMRQAGRFLPEYRELRAGAGSFLDLVYNPQLAAEVTLQPLRRFGMDAAILFSDILVIPDALGQKVDFIEGRGPVLEPVRSMADLAELRSARMNQRLERVFETVARVREGLPEGAALIGFAGAPWTVATYMVEGGGSKDHGRTKDWSYRDQQGFGELLETIVEATAEYLIGQVRAGAEVLQLFDTWAGSLSGEGFKAWCMAPTKRLVGLVKAECPEIPIIGFPKGAGVQYKPYFAETGVDCIGLDTGVPLDWAADQLQPIGPVQGNLDPRLLVVGGEPMLEAATRIVEGFSGGGHIFNLGHGIVPEVPPENLAELVKFLKSSGPS